MRNLIPLPCLQVSVNVPQSMFFLQLKDVNIYFKVNSVTGQHLHYRTDGKKING